MRMQVDAATLVTCSQAASPVPRAHPASLPHLLLPLPLVVSNGMYSEVHTQAG